ncbi:uncharacterized protein LOC141680040 [Apium graveolens]|uniref:uncharacterized protein LOC141680040 n=1 Tax=Apium graveolens TaxID=4045 RepID=UPI003D7C0D54
MSFQGHRRYLPRHHPYRKKKAAFNGEQELGFARPPLSGEEVLLQQERIKFSFGEAVKKSKKVDSQWKKNQFSLTWNIGNSIIKKETGYVRVQVDGIIKEDALVPVPIASEIETIRQAVGSLLAWPEDMVIFTPVTGRNLEMKKLQPSENVPRRFMLLYKHAVTIMKEANDSIQIPCGEEVFGVEKLIYLLHENVMALLGFKMIGQAAISTYMAYLQTKVRKRKHSDMFAFLDPSATFKLNDDFQNYIIARMRSGPSRIFLLPQNESYHWILIMIWESEIFILNPLPHQKRFTALEEALVGAIRSYNAQIGHVNKNPTIKNLIGSPKQPGGSECGYVVMRYMKDIYEDKEMKFLSKWGVKCRKSYTKEQLDEVRFETLQYIQEFV